MNQVLRQSRQRALSRCDQLLNAADSPEYVGDEALASVAIHQCKPSSTRNRTLCTDGLTWCQPTPGKMITMTRTLRMLNGVQIFKLRF